MVGNLWYNISDFKNQFISVFGIGQEKLINSKKETTKKIKNPKICVVYLASPRNEVHSDNLFKQKNIPKIDVLIESIKTCKKFLSEYPIIIFHEDFNSQDIKKIMAKSKVKDINFIKVDFKTYKNSKNVAEWLLKQKDAVAGRPAGYRMMCRFFSGVLQRHSAMREFDYYVRMDHDSFLIEPKNLDVVKCAEKYNFDYLYRTTWFDHKEKESIWKFTKQYAKKNYLSLNGFKKLKMLDSTGNFNGLAPYNNFHICKLDFWRRKEVQKFLKEVEKVDGNIKLHWHDTNVHSMLFGLFDARVLEKTDFGYRHNIHYSKMNSLKIKLIPNGKPEDWP